MHYEILTIFPEIFEGFKSSGLISKAIAAGHISINCHNIRDFAEPPHFKVDDEPYGGGAGMVFKPEPLAAAVKKIRAGLKAPKTILLSPAGEPLTQKLAQSLSRSEEMILVCGRYEGVDQRFVDLYIDQEISVGDVVLMGGEVPAMALIEATARLIPGVIGNQESLSEESFGDADYPLLEAPQYTRPPEFEGLKVPDVLLSGNHEKIAAWRRATAMERTHVRRPDLVKDE
ncbi:MAG: tRNA (guanosine(37)-N1)-methyltransferase TrmD [Candidatus Dadabacteria bacterium]|nr:MAG: tRNA (guanosine(37)-N1)-methyltransferase TrmD [Candidatus Dadabacteria bacterium]